MPETSGWLMRWLGGAARRPAWLVLGAADEALAAAPPERFARAWLGVMGFSLLWGALMVNVWGLAWEVFGGVEPLVMPAMAATAALCLGPFRRAFAAAAELLAGPDPTARAVVAAGLVVVAAFSLLGLGPYFHRWGDLRLPDWLAWLMPHAKHSRVLLLMPAWGAWAMLVGGKFHRPGGRTEPQLAALLAGFGAVAAAAFMAALMLVTIVYFQHLGTGSQVLILAVTLPISVVAGLLLCRRAGGPTRRALLATNLAGQFAFVLAYLAGRYLASR